MKVNIPPNAHWAGQPLCWSVSSGFVILLPSIYLCLSLYSEYEVFERHLYYQYIFFLSVTYLCAPSMFGENPFWILSLSDFQSSFLNCLRGLISVWFAHSTVRKMFPTFPPKPFIRVSEMYLDLAIRWESISIFPCGFSWCGIIYGIIASFPQCLELVPSWKSEYCTCEDQLLDS